MQILFRERGRFLGFREGPQLIQSTGYGGMVSDGVWGRDTWGTEQANRPGCYDIKFSSEAASDKIQNGLALSRENEKISRCSFVICNIASLTPRPTHDPKADPKAMTQTPRVGGEAGGAC